MAKQEFSIESITSNEVAKKKLLGFISEACMVRRKIKSEQEALRDIRSEARDNLGIPPKFFNKLVMVELSGDGTDGIAQEVSDLEKLECLHEMLEDLK